MWPAITTIFNGQSFGSSFIDPDRTVCTARHRDHWPSNLPGRAGLTARRRSENSRRPIAARMARRWRSDSTGDTDTLNGDFTAFSEVGGPNPGLFDWGLPFFYGRSVFVAIEGQSTPGGTGPYWAY
jgi:hypothetical protein